MKTKSKITPAYSVQCGRRHIICDTLADALTAWKDYLATLRSPRDAEGGEVRLNGWVTALFTLKGEVL